MITFTAKNCFSYCKAKSICYLSGINGIFIIIRPDFIPKVIAVVCGLYMLISGIVNIQDSLNLRRAGVESWNVSCISASVTTLVGILLLFDPLILGETAMIVLGIALLVSGVTNIFGCFTAGSKLKKVNKLMKKELKDRPDKVETRIVDVEGSSDETVNVDYVCDAYIEAAKKASADEIKDLELV